MTKEELKKAAADSFAGNPDVNELFQAPDGQCFIEKGEAQSYALSLKKRGIGQGNITVESRTELSKEIAEMEQWAAESEAQAEKEEGKTKKQVDDEALKAARAAKAEKAGKKDTGK